MRLLLLEDEPDLADAMSAHLVANGFVVDAVGRLAQARSALGSAGFDALLIDLGLPDGDGLTLVSDLRQQGSRVPIIIMTARDRISDRIRGLEAGADDYLVKPFDLDEMIARLRAVTRRYEGTPNPLLAFGDLAIDRSGRRVLLAGAELALTAKEWALLEKLSSRPGAIFTRDQLEQTIYGFDDEIGSNTLEVYVSRLRKKVGRDRIETVRGLGYRFRGE